MKKKGEESGEKCSREKGEIEPPFSLSHKKETRNGRGRGLQESVTEPKKK
jgi:hypothetical protein